MDGEVPTDPWGNEYQYAYPPERGKGDFPDIWSWGPDGEDDTEDDITNWGAAGEGGEGSEDLGRDVNEDIDVDVDVGGRTGGGSRPGRSGGTGGVGGTEEF